MTCLKDRDDFFAAEADEDLQSPIKTSSQKLHSAPLIKKIMIIAALDFQRGW